jgi:N-acetylmuramoyl-L-alanine amidase
MADPDPIPRRLFFARLGQRLIALGALGWTIPGHANGLAAPQPAVSPVKPLIMLDPGHGGRDPGAIGKAGTHEKHIALAAARDLRALLETDKRYRVELTRSHDNFVALDDRVSRARARGAALFVSIHADALPDPGVRGASVYTLAANASDAQTAALAKRENSADRFLGPAWRDTPPEVARILGSLVRRETHAGSQRIARGMVGALHRELPMLPNPTRHAGFAVLKAADIPSVLVEMGFLSNSLDEAALRKPEHRRLVAGAMKRAIDGFFAAAARSAETEIPPRRAG